MSTQSTSHPDMSKILEKIDISAQHVYSFTMPTYSPDTPYNGLPPLPPAEVVETVPVLKAIIDAKEKLAELRTACQLIPNPEIITSTIPLRELVLPPRLRTSSPLMTSSSVRRGTSMLSRLLPPRRLFAITPRSTLDFPRYRSDLYPRRRQKSYAAPF